MRYVIALGVLAAVLQMTPVFGQAPDPQPPGAAVPPDQRMRGESDGSTIDAVLDKSLDAKKNKPNDPVSATLSGEMKASNGVNIPKGSKLIGHITEAKPKAKGDPNSQLGIAFDKVVPKGGAEIPVHASIRGLFKPQPALMESDGMPAGPGVQPGLGGPAGPTGGPGAPGSSPGPGGRATTGVDRNDTPPSDASGGGRQRSQGGIAPVPGLSVEPKSGEQEGATLITSTTRTVHLDSGTHLALQFSAEKH